MQFQHRRGRDKRIRSFRGYPIFDSRYRSTEKREKRRGRGTNGVGGVLTFAQNDSPGAWYSRFKRVLNEFVREMHFSRFNLRYILTARCDEPG